MKTNFETWYRCYAPVLFVYYQRFSAMFDPSEKPTFHQFMVHCFRNTKQTAENTLSVVILIIYFIHNCTHT